VKTPTLRALEDMETERDCFMVNGLEFSMKGIKIFPKKKKIFSLGCLRG